jgi:hypothetical protein
MYNATLKSFFNFFTGSLCSLAPLWAQGVCVCVCMLFICYFIIIFLLPLLLFFKRCFERIFTIIKSAIKKIQDTPPIFIDSPLFMTN